ncbi:MAG: helix-turn-helix domain-containing protein [Bacteroidota bacterium]
MRIAKGFSQEELANASLLNLRTIQRIEKNETKPYPKTIALISEALEVNLEEIIGKENKEDRRYFTILHLSSLAMLLFPFGNIIAPAIFWYIRKESIVGLKKVGANLLNFQIHWTTVSIALTGYLIVNLEILMNMNTFINLLIVNLGITCLNMTISIVYAFRANYGYRQLNYPILFNIVK